MKSHSDAFFASDLQGVADGLESRFGHSHGCQDRRPVDHVDLLGVFGRSLSYSSPVHQVFDLGSDLVSAAIDNRAAAYEHLHGG